jgi:hypothetical protein
MRPTTAKLRLYDESMVQELGECDFQCSKFKDEQHLLKLSVLSSTHYLLSVESCTKMDS